MGSRATAYLMSVTLFAPIEFRWTSKAVTLAIPPNTAWIRAVVHGGCAARYWQPPWRLSTIANLRSLKHFREVHL